MPSLVERCRELRDEVAGLDPARLSGEACRVLAEELARTEKALAAARARTAARAAEGGAHRNAGFSDPAGWVARSTGSSLGAARAELHTTEEVGRCPSADQALREGRLSLAEAGEIARTEAVCPGSGAELVAVAARSGLSGLRDEARRRRLAAVGAEELAARQRRARRFRHWTDAEGMVCCAGALEPRPGVALVNRLEAEAARLRRRARREGGDEAFEAHAADALVALAAGRATPGRGRAEVVVVCDLRALRRGHAHPGEACHVVGGGPVPVSAVVDELEGDAFVKAVAHDGVRIDTVAHLGRAIPAHLRTALELGTPPSFDGPACAEAGCGRRFGLEWDHVDPVANGGPTSYANLQARCRPCHWAKTERDRAAGLVGNRRPAGGRREAGEHDPP